MDDCFCHFLFQGTRDKQEGNVAEEKTCPFIDEGTETASNKTMSKQSILVSLSKARKYKMVIKAIFSIKIVIFANFFQTLPSNIDYVVLVSPLLQWWRWMHKHSTNVLTRGRHINPKYSLALCYKKSFCTVYKKQLWYRQSSYIEIDLSRILPVNGSYYYNVNYLGNGALFSKCCWDCLRFSRITLLTVELDTAGNLI